MSLGLGYQLFLRVMKWLDKPEQKRCKDCNTRKRCNTDLLWQDAGNLALKCKFYHRKWWKFYRLRANPRDINWFEWSARALAAVLVLYVLWILAGCTAWHYERDAEGIRVGRSTFFMWGQADFVQVRVDPNGVKTLTIADLLLDPEKVKAGTPYGTAEGGD